LFFSKLKFILTKEWGEAISFTACRQTGWAGLKIQISK